MPLSILPKHFAGLFGPTAVRFKPCGAMEGGIVARAGSLEESDFGKQSTAPLNQL